MPFRVSIFVAVCYLGDLKTLSHPTPLLPPSVYAVQSGLSGGTRLKTQGTAGNVHAISATGPLVSSPV